MNISVIIPVLNEQRSIGDLLNALLKQTLPPAEIIVADAGSTDDSRAIVSQFIAQGSPVKLLREDGALPGRGRNLAAAQASSDWLALIDAGTNPEPNWLESLSAEANGHDVVYGTYEPVVDSAFKVCSAMAYIAPPFVEDGKRVRPRSIVSMLMRRSVWEAVGGFPEHLRSAEDLLFMRKITDNQFRVARAADAVVHWQIEGDAWKLFRRFSRYARSNMKAGLWSEWQLPLLKRYTPLLLLFIITLFLGGWWLLLAPALWLMWLNVRAIVRIRRNRECYPANAVHTLSRMVLIVPIIALLDIATVVGTLRWVFSDAFKSQRARQFSETRV